MSEPALARQAGHGHPDHHEEFDRRKRIDPERHGDAEESRLIPLSSMNRSGIVPRIPESYLRFILF